MVSSEQKAMEKFLYDVIEERKKNQADSIIGMMEPSFISCSYEDRTLTVLFNTKAWMRNPVGILHGGMTAAMLDNAMGMMVKYYTPDQSFAPTVNMNIDYIKQIPINESIAVKAQIVASGSTLIRTRAEAKISGKTGAVASAVATYYVNGF